MQEQNNNLNSPEPDQLAEVSLIAGNWSDPDLDKPSYARKIHDLRSPLTSLLGLVELLKLQRDEPSFTEEDLSWYIREIESQALRMRGMLE